MLALVGTYLVATAGDFGALRLPPQGLFWGLCCAVAATFLSIQPLLIAGMIYLFVTTVLSWAVRRLERRLKASD